MFICECVLCWQGVLSREQPKVERLQLEQENDNREDDNDYEAELQNLGVEADAPLNTATTANSELLREAHMLSRAHHGSPNIMTPLGEQVTARTSGCMLLGVSFAVLRCLDQSAEA